MLPLLYHPRRQLSGAITTPKRFTAKISTNLGPLLSTFTPSAACASNTGLTVFDQGPITVYWAEGPMSTGSQGCYPSSYSPDLFHYYSPGLCPSGYTTACTSLNSIGTVTETIHTCCPKALGISWSCLPSSAAINWATTLACTTMFTTMVTVTSLTAVSSGVTSVLAASSYASGGGIGAYGIVIRYQSTDFVTSSSSRVASTSLISSSNNSVAAVSNGLTSGASAGIGVGAGVGVLLIGIGGILLWRRSRSKNKISPHELPTQQQELPKVYEPVSRPIYEVSGLQAYAAEITN